MGATNQFTEEIVRIKKAYVEFWTHLARYAWHRPEILLAKHRMQSEFASLYTRSGMPPMPRLEVLDVGCGFGDWLRQLQEWGASPNHLHGIDLLERHIEEAKARDSRIDYQVANGWEMPFAECSMDLVSALTVFSSVLNPVARACLASEMMRIVRPGGVAMVLDFWTAGPRNPDRVGIPASEVRRLFPGFRIRRRSFYLAPPIARRVAPLSTKLATVMEWIFPFLRTHAIYFIKKP